MIFMCGMYRKLEDEYSTIQLKIGDSLNWTFGYKIFDSKGDYEPNLTDGGSGVLTILDQASYLFNASLAVAATTLTLYSF